MQKDIAARALARLGLGDGASGEETDEIEARAAAMMRLAVRAILASAGHAAAVRVFSKALDAVARSQGQPEEPDQGAFAASVLAVLRRHDPLDVARATHAHDEAGAMILGGAAFLQERHGVGHMAGYVANLIQALHAAHMAGDEPVSPQIRPAPVLPPPPGLRNLTPQPRKDLSVPQRVEIISAFLRASTPEEAEADASAFIVAGAHLVRERFGEAPAIVALRDAERSVSAAAALDRWQPEGALRQ